MGNTRNTLHALMNLLMSLLMSLSIATVLPSCTGPEGPPGTPGASGTTGPSGTPGMSGEPGPTGVSCWDLDGDPACDVSEDTNGDGICDVWDCRAGSRGVLFTRWGRDDCPAGTSEVYIGYAAGGHVTHSGSGSNTLCLSGQPTWDDYSDGNQNGALIYGLEYQVSGYGVGSLAPLQDQDPLCVVCLDDSANLQLMVPGTQACPSGWNNQYQGYLMANHYTQNKSEFVCVDREPEGRDGGSADQNGSLWYPTEAECGSLPCGGDTYVQDRELTCSVCTR